MIDQADPTYQAIANALDINDDEDAPAPSSYWGFLDGDDLGDAVIDRWDRYREWLHSSGISRGWAIKAKYYSNEYRSDSSIPHLSLMEQFGAQGEFSFVAANLLRSLLKTLIATCIQNPPTFEARATNTDSSATESAVLFKSVLDYYTRMLRVDQKIARAVELGVVVDQGFIMCEWDPRAVGGEKPKGESIWNGAPSVKVLAPWDVCYDPTQSEFTDIPYLIVRDWNDREELIHAYPELADKINGCRSRGEVMESDTQYEIGRFDLTNFQDASNSVQVFKLFHRRTSYMPKGRFAMFLEDGTMLFESVAGLVYQDIPVERFICDSEIDICMGRSPINELLGLQENINSLLSAISSNAASYAVQYVAVQAGTDLNPKTLGDGAMKLLQYPPGSSPPVGVNLTAIPNSLFEHLKELMSLMENVPNISGASRGQAPGANSTGSALLFLSSQTSSNAGSMAQHFTDFSAAVQTSILRILRTFARTPTTIAIMGKNVASKEIVLGEALKDFDEVVIMPANPIMNTSSGRLGMATQMLQFGVASAEQALMVAQSGNLGPATDPTREEEFFLQMENEALMEGEEILVVATDNHTKHLETHARLFNVPHLRRPALAEKLGVTNAAQLLDGIQKHMMQHMQFAAQNQAGAVQSTAAMQPGQPQLPPNSAMGEQKPEAPPEGKPAPDGGGAAAAPPGMPSPPSMPR